MDPVADLKGKEIKRATLNELVDYIAAGRGVLTEPVYPEIIRMVRLRLHFAISVTCVVLFCDVDDNDSHFMSDCYSLVTERRQYQMHALVSAFCLSLLKWQCHNGIAT